MSTTHSTQCAIESLTPAAAEDEHIQQQVGFIRSLLVTVRHFFGGFGRLFGDVADPRHPIYITYPLPSVLAAGLLMFLLRLGARRQVNLMLRQNQPSSLPSSRLCSTSRHVLTATPWMRLTNAWKSPKCKKWSPGPSRA